MTKNITFTLPAVAMEGASEAYLVGDFNNWNPEHAPKMEKQKDGSYKTVAKLEEGKTYQYRFLLNDGRWVNDYNAENYPHVEGLNVDNSEITVPVSEKTEDDKKQPAKAKAATKTAKAKADKKEPGAATQEAKSTGKTATVKSPAKTPAKKATAAKAAAPKAEKTAKSAAKKTAPKAAAKSKK